MGTAERDRLRVGSPIVRFSHSASRRGIPLWEATASSVAVVTPAKQRVAVVFGGRSSEHGISCVSGGNVLGAIDRTRWEVVPVAIGRDGCWRLAPDDPDLYRIIDGQVPEAPATGEHVILPPDPTVGGLVGVEGRRIPLDVVFPVLHGYGGEDGAIQGVCELAALACVGSGVAASAVCMDKIRTKNALVAAGIPVGPYVGIPDGLWLRHRDEVLERVAQLGLPVFVKPARAGSSVGIAKVTSPSEVVPAIEAARLHDRRVIVEAAIQGAREVECGVLGTEEGPLASECAEIEVLGDHDFYDFEAKYLESSARITVPALLSSRDREAVRSTALRTFTALGCEGMARVDVFITQYGEVLVSEPNTIPGFTASSMYPVVWQAVGVGYTQLIDTLLDDAVRRASEPEVSGH